MMGLIVKKVEYVNLHIVDIAEAFGVIPHVVYGNINCFSHIEDEINAQPAFQSYYQLSKGI